MTPTRITHPRHGAGTVLARHPSLDGRVLVVFDASPHGAQHAAPRYFWPEEITPLTPPLQCE